MYLDEKAKEMVFNLSKVISDQKQELEETENNLKMYKGWYKESQKEVEKLKNALDLMNAPTPTNMDVIESNGTNNVKL